jgi:hypothetical protein
MITVSHAGAVINRSAGYEAVAVTDQRTIHPHPSMLSSGKPAAINSARGSVHAGGREAAFPVS